MRIKVKDILTYMKELNGIKYHISYDTKNGKEEFKNNHGKAKEYILTTLKELNAISVESYCETTIIANFEKEKTEEIFKTFKDSVSDKFDYSISLVAKITIGNKIEPLIRNEGDKQLNENTIEEFKKILSQK